jgi:hypothetical protein
MATKKPLVINNTTGEPEEVQAGDSLQDTGSLLHCGSSSRNTSNQWMRRAGMAPLNLAPFFLSGKYEIISVAVVGRDADTYDIEVYRNADIVSPPNALVVVNLSSQTSKKEVPVTPVALNENDKIGVYMRGSGIAYPNVTLELKERV